jgi:transcription factor C subunit 7
MPVTTILLLRHGHRIAWTLDPTTGRYSSNHPYPTRLPADPPLASHGVRQAQETALYLATLLRDEVRQDRLRVYSSLFYRCLETLKPTMEKLREVEGQSAEQALQVRGERGLGEWFGKAWFHQPVPADPGRLKREYFPWLDESYESKILPNRFGERTPELHDRVARALGRVVMDVDEEFEAMGRGGEDATVLICGHAAQIICSGRALTGIMPEDPDDEDFRCFTCGISKFVRREKELVSVSVGDDVASVSDWRTSGGVTGGWDCVENSDCSHLSQGEERGWHFHGDESFDSYGPTSNRGPVTSDGSMKEKIEAKNAYVERGSKL